MHKKLFRTVESLLQQIDHLVGTEQMLEEILRLLVESDDTEALGVVSGRLYRERDSDYVLVKSISGLGPEITGKTVRKDYQVIRDIEQHRLWVISPESPGWDAELEAEFSDVDAAAILVGRDPAYILSLGLRHHGSEDDLMVLLETIRASVGIKLREQTLVGQMEQARVIQQSLQPTHLPPLEGFEIAALSIPAEEVGGDIYDVQEADNGVLGLMLADASGHGLPAALQARDVVIGMRMGQAENEKITTTVSRLNRVINGSGLTSRFISMFYGELDPDGNLVYVNGGHCPPLLLTPEAEVFELKVSGPVLGPLPDAEYRRGFLTMRPGEVLILFTDGVTERLKDGASGTEAPDDVEPEEFGRQGVIEVGLENLALSADEIAERLIDQVRSFGGGMPFSDDVSLMVVKRLAEKNYPPAEGLVRLSIETRR